MRTSTPPLSLQGGADYQPCLLVQMILQPPYQHNVTIIGARSTYAQP